MRRDGVGLYLARRLPRRCLSGVPAEVTHPVQVAHSQQTLVRHVTLRVLRDDSLELFFAVTMIRSRYNRVESRETMVYRVGTSCVRNPWYAS